jgi:hypothetical protein
MDVRRNPDGGDGADCGWRHYDFFRLWRVAILNRFLPRGIKAPARTRDTVELARDEWRSHRA